MAKLKTGRHTSAIKASRQAERRALRNRALRKKAREASKGVLEAVSAKDGDQAKKRLALAAASSAWDKAAKKRAVHWKTVARRKSRLARRVK